MDHDTARAQADDVRRAHLAASRPSLPRAACALSALCAGAGVALAAQGEPGRQHLAFTAAAVLLFAAAHLLPAALRRRRGLHGHRGWSRTENATFLLVAVSLLVSGSTGGRELAWIFAGLGVVSAVAWYAMLRGVLVAGGRPRA
ncbi:hypothetical protein [Kineococcus sp. SYSU DK005]|uniref:hypothetical protein n=1 Tax=Kineococcus sp. SYSU DK005 TaxID=3383126 RepID=UPI003D7EA345